MPASGPLAAVGEEPVDLVFSCRTLQLEHAVGEAGVEHRCPHGMAVQLALQLGIDDRYRGRTAGRRGLQRQHGRAGAPQILVRRVDHHIGVGRGVDGGDLAVPDAELLVHDLHHGRETIRRARGRRQQIDDAADRRAGR